MRRRECSYTENVIQTNCPGASVTDYQAYSKYALALTAVGATASLPPADYVVDHTRIKLGQGEEVFMKAKAALGRWQQFRLGWVEVWSHETPIQTGEVVAVIARNLGLWWLNACRIVYVLDEPGSVSRYGFAYGTLPDHAGTGEERFLVEWDRASGEVWYDWSAPPKLVQPKWKSPGRLTHGGTHEKAKDRRGSGAVAARGRPRSGQGTDSL